MNRIGMEESSLFSKCSFYKFFSLRDGCTILFYLFETVNDSLLLSYLLYK